MLRKGTICYTCRDDNEASLIYCCFTSCIITQSCMIDLFFLISGQRILGCAHPASCVVCHLELCCFMI
uniref:Uncharacterized protein n=1 Tax=Arundo donax TaxID=35708 RepID=A0A0A9DZX6_ARUDO